MCTRPTTRPLLTPLTPKTQLHQIRFLHFPSSLNTSNVLHSIITHLHRCRWDATDFFFPPCPSNQIPNRLYILPLSLARKPNPTLSSWCSAAQSHRRWLKRQTSIPSPVCVSQPDPCPMEVPIIVIPKWVCLVLYSIFWCDWVEGSRTKRNGEKWCSRNGEKWW